MSTSDPSITTIAVLGDADGSPVPEAWLGAIRRRGLEPLVVTPDDPWWTAAGPAIDRDRSGRTVALLGFGSGGHGALRLAYQRARDFPVVAAWRPAIDCHRLIDRRLAAPAGVTEEAIAWLRSRYEDPERCRQDSAILHVHPLGWPREQWFGCPPGDVWWEGCDRLRMKLQSLGVPFEADLDTPQNADDPALADRVVGWIAEKLAAEARRVP